VPNPGFKDDPAFFQKKNTTLECVSKKHTKKDTKPKTLKKVGDREQGQRNPNANGNFSTYGKERLLVYHKKKEKNL